MKPRTADEVAYSRTQIRPNGPTLMAAAALAASVVVSGFLILGLDDPGTGPSVASPGEEPVQELLHPERPQAAGTALSQLPLHRDPPER